MYLLLKQAVIEGNFRPLDLHFARLFTTESEEILFVVLACLSYEIGRGHVGIPLSYISQERLFQGRSKKLAEQIWQRLGNPDEQTLRTVVTTANCIGDGSQTRPIIFFAERLYLHRLWQDEGTVAAFFSRKTVIERTSAYLSRAEAVIQSLFPIVAREIDWQKVAVAMAILHPVTIISGGPGTGKTTTVAKIVVALLRLSEKPLRVQLVAPTGKASARLSDSFQSAIATLNLSGMQKMAIPQNAITLHRLLEIHEYEESVQFDEKNPLHLDLLVVDEASMVDLPLMARLVSALPKSARLILLGDRNQLAAVEAGAIFGDLCRLAGKGYSAENVRNVAKISGITLNERNNETVFPSLSDALCLLQKSYRFAADSGIGKIAQAIHSGSREELRQVLLTKTEESEWLPMNDLDDYHNLIALCVSEYGAYLTTLKTATPEQVLYRFSQFQLLCAVRQGPFGVEELNKQIEIALLKKGWVTRSKQLNSVWYVGRPVIINKNDGVLGLFNGDIGIALLDEASRLRVYFRLPDGTLKAVQPNRLPVHETVFAMTVHKSQGSEFDHTLLVLPDVLSPVVTRELVYTAVTRAKKRLTLSAKENILFTALQTLTERQSGLLERLT